MITVLITRALVKLVNDPEAIGRLLDNLDSPMPNIQAQIFKMLRLI